MLLAAGSAEVREITSGRLTRLGYRLPAVLFHKLGVATLVLVPAITAAFAGSHAKARFRVARRPAATQSANFVC